jgi:hypothetical protein
MREDGTQRLEEAAIAIEAARNLCDRPTMLQYRAEFEMKLQAVRELIRNRSLHKQLTPPATELP